MSKPIFQYIPFILILMFISIIAFIIFFYTPYTSIHFDESNAVIANPSRGFYVQFDTAQLDKISDVRESGITLVLLGYDIKDYVDREIDQLKLDELTEAFHVIRAQGLKVILRAAYGFKDPAEFFDPTSIEVIKTHLTQISPILYENRDLLLTVQAGFLGQWGEWHHSNLGDLRGAMTPQLVNELLIALCEAVPTPISIAVRRPSFIRMIDPSLVDVSRIALHNDALLSSDSDMGTYDQKDLGREGELAFIEDRPFVVPNGGEVTNLSTYTEPLIALKEFSQLKLTYLNRNYNKTVLNHWASVRYEDKPFLDVLERKLGYRWYLETLKVPTYFRSKQKVSIELTLLNSGFSAITLPYRAELIVRSDKTIVQEITVENIDLQDLKPGRPLSIKVSLDIEEPLEQFTLGIRFLEANASDSYDIQTMIRLANDNITLVDGTNIFATYVRDKNSFYELLRTD